MNDYDDLPLEEDIEQDTQIEETTLRPIADILADLSKPIPQRFLKTRTQGGQQLTYIEWHAAVKFLDFYTGCQWSNEVRDKVVLGDRVAVTVRITIYAADGVFYREATGTEFFGDAFKGYGEPITNAEAQAFKRAAAKFGLGLHLYEKH